MNDHLKRIAEQSFSFAYEACHKAGRKGGDGDHIWVQLAMAKCSQLIVRECANYAFSDDQEHKAMLKHFGVAE